MLSVISRGFAALFGIVSLADHATSQSLSWIQVAAGGPSPRYQSAISYDSLRNCAILFGGRDTGTFSSSSSETWRWSGSTWTLATLSGPAGRNGHCMAYDSARARIVLFGGQGIPTGGPGNTLYNDTWEWDGTSWSLVATNGPNTRVFGAMAYDSARGVCVLFGGLGNPNPTRYSDTWEWNGTTWTQSPTASAPSARSSAAATFDPARNRTVLFGGSDGTSFLGDTWEYDGTNWSLVSSTGPSPRVTGQMAYASILGKSVLFGGRTTNTNTYYDDTWAYDGTSWSQLATGGPTQRLSGGLLYDNDRGRIMIFGGLTVSTLWNDTWSFGFDTATVQTVGSGCAGSTGIPTLAATANSKPRIGSNLQMDLSQLPPVATVCVPFFGFNNVSLGATPLPASLAPYGMPGCTIYSDVYATSFLIGLSGSASWTLGIPISSAYAGTHLYLQSLVFDAMAPNPAGIVITNGLDATIGY